MDSATRIRPRRTTRTTRPRGVRTCSSENCGPCAGPCADACAHACDDGTGTGSTRLVASTCCIAPPAAAPSERSSALQPSAVLCGSLSTPICPPSPEERCCADCCVCSPSRAVSHRGASSCRSQAGTSLCTWFSCTSACSASDGTGPRRVGGRGQSASAQYSVVWSMLLPCVSVAGAISPWRGRC